jgi:hypothetical protein
MTTAAKILQILSYHSGRVTSNTKYFLWFEYLERRFESQ